MDQIQYFLDLFPKEMCDDGSVNKVCSAKVQVVSVFRHVTINGEVLPLEIIGNLDSIPLNRAISMFSLC